MNLFRNILLWASKNEFLKRNLPGFYFVKKAVKRFMPGKKLEDALEAAKELNRKNLGVVFTYLGENLNNISEAEAVKNHYVEVLQNISLLKLDAEVSVKLTQLGLDISFEKSIDFFYEVADKAERLNNFVWIDMEGSRYTQITLDFYNIVRRKYQNTGICLQAYLRRTRSDIVNIYDKSSSIRLVKGAYKEPPDIAYQRKSEVDNNYLLIAEMLQKQSDYSGGRIVFGTHDLRIINMIKQLAENFNTTMPEFHLLYGIKTGEQIRLAKEGVRIKTLISYGEAWFPWYMRRLAERPANTWFVLKNIFLRSLAFFL